MLLFNSCKKEKENQNVNDNNLTLNLPVYILAGQKTGNGISYTDFNPDINVIITNASIKQDTNIVFDFNNDGIDDFIFTRKVSNPLILGSSYDEIDIIALNNNEVCAIVNPIIDTTILPYMHSQLEWVDTLSANDTINGNTYWTNNKTLIYHYVWGNYGGLIQSFKEGPWANIVNSMYIGFKIEKNNKIFFGWVNLSPTFAITDFAITQEY